MCFLFFKEELQIVIYKLEYAWSTSWSNELSPFIKVGLKIEIHAEKFLLG